MHRSTIEVPRGPWPIARVPAQMESFRSPAKRRAIALIPIALLAVSCSGPEYALPPCSTTITQSMTGDIASDLVGAWSGDTDEASWHHPIAYMAALPDEGDRGGRIWMFRSDGTGHVWWVLNASGSGSYENDEEFEWRLDNGRLLVNSFPPATLDELDQEALLLHPVDPSVDPSQGVVMHRCSLEVPESVRGFDE